MRLLFLLTQDLESPAGIGRYFPWAKALAQRGHQVTIVALHSDYAHVNQKQFELDGVQVHYVAQMHVLKRGDKKIYFTPVQLIRLSLLATWQLTRAAFTTPADIIQIGKPQPMNGLAGWLVKIFRRRILCVDCDDLEAANNRFSNSWQYRIVSAFERWLPRRADHLTTHTHVLEAQLASLGIPTKKITYLPHGYDRARFTNIDTTKVERLRSKLGIEGKPVVIYVGSMSLGSHAVDLLLKAFVLVHQERPDAVLLLVGGGEDLDTVKLQANEMNLDESAIFCGRVPANATPAYYRLGNVSVDPIPDNASGRASLSLKMFETWACQVPLVTVDVGDRKEMLGDPPAGLIVPPSNPKALADAILEILNQPNLASTLAQLGFERVASFDWDHLATKIETVYERLLTREADP